mmetsp:Transcript_25900/g.74848  ORF Transcript_25900/g.74848 Transcript_25900/m.74848 type:complete len:297 (-) Transcript_25900:118-1008(-)
MHSSQRDTISVAFLRATVWSAFVIKGESYRLHPDRMSPFVEQEPAFNRDCKAFPNKRIIMVTPNLEYWDMFLNWVHHASVYMSENDQLVVVAQDEGIVTMLQNSSFTFMDLDGTLNIRTVTKHKVVGPFSSSEFRALVGKRAAQILYFLKLNCTVLYSDVDNVWLGDVFQDIAEAGSHDLYITDDSSDNALTERWYFCTCLLYLQPSPSVRELMQNWTNAVSDKTNNQPPFNQVLKRDYATRQLVDFTVLPYGAFPPGCSADRFWGTPAMHVLHANYIVGMKNKTQFLVDHHVWKQ